MRMSTINTTLGMVIGWLNVFFPELKSGEDMLLNDALSYGILPHDTETNDIDNDNDHENDMREQAAMAIPSGNGGIYTDHYPSGISRAPVLITVHTTKYHTDFNGGFVTASQHQVTGAIRPQVGWFTTLKRQDPPDHTDDYKVTKSADMFG
jgi:hypothetical protein